MIRDMLVAGKLRGVPIRTNKERIDEAAVEFSCDLLTAACICDSIRQRDRRSKVHPCRVYVCRDVAWVRQTGNVELTIVGDKSPERPNGVVKLNPAVFASARKPIQQAKPVRFEPEPFTADDEPWE